MTKPETLRALLYPTPAGPEIIIRAVDAEDDLRRALGAVRRLGSRFRVRRSWSVQRHQGTAAVMIAFELLEPKRCRRRAFHVTKELLDAWLDGCALGLSVRSESLDAGADVLKLWPREGPRIEVLDALATALAADLLKKGA